MKTEAKVVVIGGGVVGVSTLYHLAKKGWSDVVLIERKELTSGSTWHAAGLLPLFNMSYSVGQIHKYSVKFYGELEAETGQNVGLKIVSNIRLARTKDRWDEFMYYAGIAETLGIKVNKLTPEQVKEIWPLCDVTGIIGAIQHPDTSPGQGCACARGRNLSQHHGYSHCPKCRWQMGCYHGPGHNYL
jgi:dimethylglycine dehydrogenase